MKALSVKQPHANRIRSGRKKIEVRTWKTNYRGDLLIASSKKPNIAPAGAVIAVANLVDCRPMTDDDEILALASNVPGNIAWVLEGVRPIEPIPIKGSLGGYESGITFEQVRQARREYQSR